MSELTVFPAKNVVTMWPAVPEASAVAVRDERVVAVGSVKDLAVWGDYALDDTFADKVLLPGFVEAHRHVHAGALWQYPYVGFFDRKSPDGTTTKGSKSVQASLARMRELEAAMEDPDEPMIVWGYDPIYFPGERLTARDLDTVSEKRPIFVWHASAHLATVNSALMRAEGIGKDTNVQGVDKDADGEPVGELDEPPAMALASRASRAIFGEANSEASIRLWSDEARNAGVTTMAELASASPFTPEAVERWHRVVNDPSYPARIAILPLFGTVGGPADPAEFAAMVKELDRAATPKLRFPGVKLVLDGSIQGFSARLRPPGYLTGPNGLWNLPPKHLGHIVEAIHRAGLIVYCHVNGDEAVDVFLDAVERALAADPRPDHRHAAQHAQLTHVDQFRRMAALGVSANLFSNHIFYWGDQHASCTVGPDRAASMNAAATALREGVSLALHSDVPITPLAPLHEAWCAVNRLTATGLVLGEHERIGVGDALRAVTLGPAYQLSNCLGMQGGHAWVASAHDRGPSR